MENSVVFQKSKRFAGRIVKLSQYLRTEKKDYVLSRQLLRSGTSIGANIAEAEAAISRKDFLAKMYIAFKETAETKYWIDLLYESAFLSEKEYASIIRDCHELYSMLSAITKSTAQTLSKYEEVSAADNSSLLTPNS